MPRPVALPRGITEYSLGYQVYVVGKNGERIRERLRGATLDQAKARMNILRADVVQEKYIPRKARITVGEICEKAKAILKSKRADWQTACGRVDVVKGWWGTMEARDLKPSTIELKLNAQVEAGEWHPTTAREYRAIIAQVFNIAMMDDDPDNPAIPANPVKRMPKLKKIRNQRKRVLSLEEETQLRTVITPAQNLVIDLALHVGCRRSNFYGISRKGYKKEIPPLTWEAKDINSQPCIDMNFRIVRFLRTKSGEPYFVPMNAVAYAAFQKLREAACGHGPLFPTKSPKKWFETALRNAKLENLNFHDLRHTFASRMRAAGVAHDDREFLLGHEMNDVKYTYAVENIEQLRQAVATLEKPELWNKGQNDQRNDQTEVLSFRKAATA